ncbi:S41 family peptidase [Dyadobacter sp. CY343]|uniref:S41 family peptidase n=1 Tax=Dyadobacter sp. CY343 TaxID=2907299 RepID=UPI001F23B9DB|nr:S41 family peptidase [Dyadobacter sp. CY343]MCE7060835.1 S41 family peptidase [Dyadobacter sp. CY343]
MKRTLTALAFLCLPFLSAAQNQPAPADFNLDFEKKNPGQKLPDKWMQWGTNYQVVTDSTEKHNGKNSVLLKAPDPIPNGTFGSVASTIPAQYMGKEIELRGYLKFRNVTSGWVGLMLRIDGKAGTLQFNNMQEKAINGTSDWKQYSIKLPYSSSAAKIHIGALLAGPGELWTDDLELFIDGKPFYEAPVRKPLAAELDKEFDKGSNVVLDKLTPALTQDLSDLGRLWGFLKYYHPAVKSGNHNWDYELFRILPQLTSAKSKAEKEKILYQWIKKLGPVNPGSAQPIPETAVLKPTLNWLSNPAIGKEMQALLDTIKNAKKTHESYYISMYPDVGNPEFKNENPYPQMQYSDAGYRLLSLFRYWNMIEYFFPYKSLIKEDWQAVLTEFIPKFINATDETSYKLTTLELIGRVKDTHANIYNQQGALNKFFGEKYAPAQLTFIENKPVVTDYYNAALGEKSGLKIGDIVEKINGKSIAQLIKEKLPHSPASNYPTQLRVLSSNLLRTNDTTISVSIRRNNKVQDLVVPAFGTDKINIYANFNKADTCFKMLSPDIAYLYPGKWKNTYMSKLTPEISKSKGLIIDMRCYPSDFMVFSFGPYLLPEAKPFVKFTMGSFHTPGMFTFGRNISIGSANPNYYKGKIILIVNESSQSQAEYTSMTFKTAPNITVIGSTTAGADGNISSIVLPGNIYTGISGVGIYYPDGKETQQVGIVPDLQVTPTIQGIISGKDELLEKAVQLLTDSK